MADPILILDLVVEHARVDTLTLSRLARLARFYRLWFGPRHPGWKAGLALFLGIPESAVLPRGLDYRAIALGGCIFFSRTSEQIDPLEDAFWSFASSEPALYYAAMDLCALHHHRLFERWYQSQAGWASRVGIQLKEKLNHSAVSGVRQLHLGGIVGRNVPDSIGNFVSITELGLHGDIDVIPPTIGGLRCLTRLRIIGTRITTLPGSIGFLGALTDLRLSNNLITHLPDSLASLSRLEILYLNSNPLGDFPRAVLALRQRLRILNLSSTQLARIPVAIGSLAALKELYLSGNPLLGALPESLADLDALDLLELSGNSLVHMTPRVFAMSCKTVKLARNRLMAISFCPDDAAASASSSASASALTSASVSASASASTTAVSPTPVPPSGRSSRISFVSVATRPLSLWLDRSRVSLAESLDHSNDRTWLSPRRSESFIWTESPSAPPARLNWRLKILDLSHNSLASIPASIAALAALEHLILSNNRLGQLPGELSQLSRLHTLDVSHNQIELLPPSIGRLERLHTFDASHNSMRALPESIAALLSLHRLLLHGNPDLQEYGPLTKLARSNPSLVITLGEQTTPAGIKDVLGSIGCARSRLRRALHRFMCIPI
ncbi:uncharacterized protein BJ171DRAFT_278384 [Polychytrium aggregatum]|uniref:uncharacterized protein n=1 Tax=Polychytrium aggregatum TaxID=110093 RepID=UPI0022FF1C71|nr:uncharacterized protein BJ171DRAFT_278384 [Polychytrium aggregatum]KAI9207613.1 hypothetical protein BJ171DRAFT_278384 [Polychytrium aggregatum]